MTGGFDKGGSDNGGPGGNEKGGNGAPANAAPAIGAGSTRHALPRDDREALSALFDGELPGEAAKFALRRLDHDLHWRESCGRWQLIGDVLRGETIAVAPPTLAITIAQALGQSPAGMEIAAPVPPPAPARPAPSRRWVGGVALAASVALAAVLVVRPFGAAPVPSSPTVAEAPASLPDLPAAQPAAPGGESNADAMPAVRVATVNADVPRAERRVARRRAAPVASGRDDTGSAVGAIATAIPPPVARPQPFHPPVEEITTRPWPRAVMPESSAVGAFTVGLETQSVPATHPFEPPTPVEPASAGDTPP